MGALMSLVNTIGIVPTKRKEVLSGRCHFLHTEESFQGLIVPNETQKLGKEF